MNSACQLTPRPTGAILCVLCACLFIAPAARAESFSGFQSPCVLPAYTANDSHNGSFAQAVSVAYLPVGFPISFPQTQNVINVPEGDFGPVVSFAKNSRHMAISVFALSVICVGLCVSKKKVSRINACRVVAFMKDVRRVGKASVFKQPSAMTGPNGFGRKQAGIYMPVALAILSSSPKPAFSNLWNMARNWAVFVYSLPVSLSKRGGELLRKARVLSSVVSHNISFVDFVPRLRTVTCRAATFVTVLYILTGSRAFGATNVVIFDLGNFGAEAVSFKQVKIAPVSPASFPRVEGVTVVGRDYGFKQTDANGRLTNAMVSGTYDITFTNRFLATTFQITVPTTNASGYLYASELTTSGTNAPGNLVAYSQSAADNRFPSIAGTNIYAETIGNRIKWNVVGGGGSGGSATNAIASIYGDNSLVTSGATELGTTNNGNVQFTWTMFGSRPTFSANVAGNVTNGLNTRIAGAESTNAAQTTFINNNSNAIVNANSTNASNTARFTNYVTTAAGNATNLNANGLTNSSTFSNVLSAHFGSTVFVNNGLTASSLAAGSTFSAGSGTVNVTGNENVSGTGTNNLHRTGALQVNALPGAALALIHASNAIGNTTLPEFMAGTNNTRPFVVSNGLAGVGLNNPTNHLDVNGHTSLRSNVFAPNLGSNNAPVAFLGRDAGGRIYDTYVPSAGGGEANVNGEVSVTNSTRFGLVNGKSGVTNLLRSLQSGSGILLTNEGTNIVIATTGAGTAQFAPDGSGNITNINTGSVIAHSGFNSTNIYAGDYTFVAGKNAGVLSSLVSYSAFVGESAGYGATNCPESTMFGYYAGYMATNCQALTAIGWRAGVSLYDSSSAIAIGYQNMDGAGAMGSAVSIGVHNFQGAYNCAYTVAIGYYMAAAYTNAYNGVWIGGKGGTNAAYKLWIDGYEGINLGVTPLLYGDFLSRYLYVNGRLTVTNKVNIGTNADATTHTLQVVGNARINAVDFPAPNIVSNVNQTLTKIQSALIFTNNAMSNFVMNVRLTNRYEIFLTNNLTITNITPPAAGDSAEVIIFITPQLVPRGINWGNLGFSNPGYGVALGTNANSPVWTTLTNGITYVASYTWRGTNGHLSLTEWK